MEFLYELQSYEMFHPPTGVRVQKNSVYTNSIYLKQFTQYTWLNELEEWIFQFFWNFVTS